MIEDTGVGSVVPKTVVHRNEIEELSSDGISKAPTFLERVAKWFGMRDATRASFEPEILGGISMFLSSVYMSKIGASVLLHGTVFTLPMGNDCDEIASLASSFSIVIGVCTILNGLVASAPCVSGPGITFCIAYAAFTNMVAPAIASSANALIGLILIPFVFLMRRYKIEQHFPEDYRLGLGAGIGVLVSFVSLKMLATNASLFKGLYLVSAFAFACVLSAFQSRKYRLYSMVFGSCLMTGFLVLTYLWNDFPIFGNLSDCPLAPKPYTHIPQLGTWGNGDLSSKTGLNSTAHEINLTCAYRYVIIHVLEKLFNVPGTIAALILLRVDTKVGYTKETFRKTFSESKKLFKVFMLDCIMNCLLVPFLGVGLVTPYLESAAGIILGAHTGLSSVIAGSLFLLTSPIAYQISTVLGTSSSAIITVFASFFIVASMRHVEHIAPTSYIPGYLVFLLIPAIGIAGGAAFGFVVYVVASLGRKNSILNPQILWMFGGSVLFLVVFPQDSSWKLSRPQVTASWVSIMFCTIVLSVFIHCRNSRLDLPSSNTSAMPVTTTPSSQILAAQSQSSIPSLKPPLVLNVRSARVPSTSLNNTAAPRRPPGLASIKSEYVSSELTRPSSSPDVEAPASKLLNWGSTFKPSLHTGAVLMASARPRGANKGLALLDDGLMAMTTNQRSPTSVQIPTAGPNVHSTPTVETPVFLMTKDDKG